MVDASEFVIDGAFAFVLRISRFCGCAPLHLKQLGSSYVARIVNSYAIGSCIIITAINLFIICGFIIYFTKSALLNTTAFYIFFIGDITFTITIVFLGVYGGRQRMNRFFKYVICIRKIDVKNSCAQILNEKLKMLIALSITGNCALITLELFIFVTKMKDHIENEIIISVYCVLCLAHFILFLLEVQTMCTVLMVHAALQRVNREMARLRTTADTNNIATFSPSWKVREKFCDYRDSYIYILNLARQINRNEGPMLLLIFFYTCLSLVISGRQFIYRLNIPVDTPFRTLVVYGEMVLFMSYIFKLIFIIDPCHRTQQEVEETKSILGHLMCKTNSSCHSFLIELKMFGRQLLHQPPLYSPLNICTLERPLLTTVIAFVMTILVTVAQMSEAIGD